MGGIVSTALPVLEYCNPSFNKINSEPDPTLEKKSGSGAKNNGESGLYCWLCSLFWPEILEPTQEK